MKVNSRKVAVIGCGFVGSSSAFALMQSGLFSEMVLIDADTDRAEGEAMDISHGISFARPMQIYAGNYDDITDAAIIVITAGANQKPGETRLDLIKKNAAIMKSIIGEIKKRDFGGILLLVSYCLSGVHKNWYIIRAMRQNSKKGIDKSLFRVYSRVVKWIHYQRLDIKI